MASQLERNREGPGGEGQAETKVEANQTPTETETAEQEALAVEKGNGKAERRLPRKLKRSLHAQSKKAEGRRPFGCAVAEFTTESETSARYEYESVKNEILQTNMKIKKLTRNGTIPKIKKSKTI